MKMEWLQNDHRQYVECAEDLNLAGSCTPPPMEWSDGGRAVQAELRSCVATLAILLINIQRLEAREATIRCPINYHLEPWTNQLFIKMPRQRHAVPKNSPHSWNWDCILFFTYISRLRLVSNKSCACQIQINVDHAPPAFPVCFDF